MEVKKATEKNNERDRKMDNLKNDEWTRGFEKDKKINALYVIDSICFQKQWKESLVSCNKNKIFILPQPNFFKKLKNFGRQLKLHLRFSAFFPRNNALMMVLLKDELFERETLYDHFCKLGNYNTNTYVFYPFRIHDSCDGLEFFETYICVDSVCTKTFCFDLHSTVNHLGSEFSNAFD